MRMIRNSSYPVVPSLAASIRPNKAASFTFNNSRWTPKVSAIVFGKFGITFSFYIILIVYKQFLKDKSDDKPHYADISSKLTKT